MAGRVGRGRSGLRQAFVGSVLLIAAVVLMHPQASAGPLALAEDPAAAIVSIDPARLVDTRAGRQTVDGQVEGVGRLAARSVLEVPVLGRGGVPGDDVGAVVLNVTAVEPAAAGYLTVYPCGSTRPTASSVNYEAGQVVPNAVFAKVGKLGRVCVYTLSPVDVVVDVGGYSTVDSGAEPLEPARLVDTRSGRLTVDGQGAGTGRLPPDSVLAVKMVGRGGVPATGVAAVVVNVTAVNPDAAGHLTVYPCGSAPPTASNVNYRAGQVVPNAVLAKVGADGTICVYTFAGTDVVVDVNGYIDGVAGVTPVEPRRLADTRADGRTVDGRVRGVGRRPADSVLVVPVRGRGGVPSVGAAGVFLNVTAVNPAAAGFITVYPCGRPVPGTSNVNYLAGQVVANAVVAKVGLAGAVCVYTSAETDLVVDVSAWIDGIASNSARGFRSVSVGSGRACAIRTDHTPVCWGTFDEYWVEPTGIFTELHVGGARSCGLRLDNTVDCWGVPNGYFGGDVPTPGGTFNTIAVGGTHACGLRVDGTAACWGQTYIWDWTNGGGTPPSGLFTSLTAGLDFTCGLQAGGRAGCWGHGLYANTAHTFIPLAGTWRSLSAGSGQVCGVRVGGTLTCTSGGTEGDTDVPTGRFVDVAPTRGGFGCAVRTDRSAVCWGVDRHGDSVEPAPGEFTELSGAYGAYQNWCGLRPDRTIACWGDTDSPVLNVPPP